MKSTRKILKSITAMLLIVVMAAGMASSLGKKAEAANYYIVVSGNGGTIGGKSSYTTYVYTGSASSGTFTFPADTPVRSGYYFAGYAETANTTIAKYYPEQRITVSGAKNFYAVWIRQDGVYQIKYDSNGGTYVGSYDGAKIITSYAGAGQSCTLTANKFTAPSRRFGGWSKTPGGTVVYSNTASVKPTSNMTLYPRWQVQVTIHYMDSAGKERKTTQTTWEYEKVSFLSTATAKNYLEDGYYWGDKNKNKIYSGTLCTVGLHVYSWPRKDEITIRLQNANTLEYSNWTMVVYTGDSIAMSKQKNGSAYPIGRRFGDSSSYSYVLGWKLYGGPYKNQNVSVNLPLIFHDEKYTADVCYLKALPGSDGQQPVQYAYILMSGLELRTMYEMADKAYIDLAKDKSSTVNSLLEKALKKIGKKLSDFPLGKAFLVAGTIYSITNLLKKGYYSSNKDQLLSLRSNLESLVGTWTSS